MFSHGCYSAGKMSGTTANNNNGPSGPQDHMDKVVSALHTAGLESMVYTMAETSSAQATATAMPPSLAFANFPTPVSLPQVQVIQQPYLQQLYTPTLVPGGITFQPALHPFSVQLQQAKPSDPKQQLLSNFQAAKGLQGLPHGAVFATAQGNKMVVNKLQAGPNQPLLLGQLLTAGQPQLLPATSKPPTSVANVATDKRVAGTLQPKTAGVQPGMKQYPGQQVLAATSQTTQILGSFQQLAPAGGPPQMMGHPGLTWTPAPAYLPNQPFYLRQAAPQQQDLILQASPTAPAPNPQPANTPMAAAPRPRMMRPASSVATQTAGVQSVPVSNVMPQAATAQHKFRSLAPKSPEKVMASLQPPPQQQQQHYHLHHHHQESAAMMHHIAAAQQPSIAKVVAMPTVSQPQTSIAITTSTTTTATPIVFQQEVMEVPQAAEPLPTVPVLPQQHAPSPSSSSSSSDSSPASEEMLDTSGKAEQQESTPEPPPQEKTPPPTPLPPASTDKTTAIVKPQILTHFIDGFVIHEGPDPFPITRSSLKPDILPVKKVEKQPKPGKKRGPKPGRPREMAKCEFCGVISAKSKFKKSKRFCTKSCAKRYNANCAKRLSAKLHNQSPLPPEAAQEAAAAAHQDIIPSVDLVQDEEDAPQEVVVSPPEVLEIKVEPEMTQAEQRTSAEPTRNIATWTVDEVVAYVRTLPGCAEYADEFLQQEIDGQALMLLKEDHLMTTMSMKLGPALKMFSCISSLRDVSVEPSSQ